MKKIWLPFVVLAGLTWILSAANVTAAHPLASYTPDTQTPALFYNEARTVYLGNLQRRANGIPPLRWNREMTLAARWFSWDSVENRTSYCGHTDTQGGAPWDRMAFWGYSGFGGAENAYCGYMTPEDAITGWMNSSGHRANLLSPDWREIGLGYYLRGSDGNGYITQDFGVDSVYPPVIIENEAPNTTSSQVHLYIYNSSGSGGLTDIGPATQMKVSNTACFAGDNWQAYKTEPTWTLTSGEGWKTVYSRLQDRLGRTLTANDTIYYGATVPTSELSFSQMSQNSSSVNLYNLNSGGMPKVQLSLGWIHDDENFDFLWGSGSRVNDSAAIGGTTYQLNLSNMESSAWVYTSDFIADAPMVAYFRLKTSSNSSTNEVARIMVEPNEVGTTRTIKGTDFKAANQYQEFAIPFTYHRDTNKPFLIFQFWRSGTAVISVDTVTIFTASQTLNSSTFNWDVPGHHYRGQGVWVRYADDSGGFSGYQEAETTQSFGVNPQHLTLLAETQKTSQHNLVQVTLCGNITWFISSKPGWLASTSNGNILDVYANAAGLSPNTYIGNLVLQPSSGNAVTIPVKLVVVNQLAKAFLPAARR